MPTTVSNEKPSNMTNNGNLIKKEKRQIGKVMLRSLKLRCPACGESSIIERPFRIKTRCSSCDAVFKREEGFFVGAILANIVITELVILALYFLTLPIFADRDELILGIMFGVAIIFPIAFYHHSWSLWLGFDHLVESLPHEMRKHDRWG